MKNYKNIILLFISFLIIVSAIFFRTKWLEISPSSINFDEAALGYNAYSILKTGRDEHGFFLPISLASFNDYKPALYAYLDLPFIKLMGLTQTSTRLVSAILGTITIIFTALFVYFFFSKNIFIAVFALFLASIQPWSLHYSRTAFEANIAAAIFTVGVFTLFAAQNRKTEILGTLLLALSMYGYHSPRVAAPVFLFLYLLIKNQECLLETFKTRQRKFDLKKLLPKFIKIGLPLILLITLSLPIWANLRQGLILTRLKQESALKRLYPYSPPELTNKENIWSTFPGNPAYYLAGQFTGHFMSYFSPINLGGRIFRWVEQSPQHIPDFSMLGWGESIFFLAGLLFLIKNVKEKKSLILLAWIVSGILPAMVTWNWFHPLRSLNLFPALLIVSILGIVQGYRSLTPILKAAAILVSVPLFVMQTAFVINNEIVYGVVKAYGEYQPGGYKEGINTLVNMQNTYDKVIIDTPHAQAYIFFLYYQAFPPNEIQKYQNTRKGPGNEGDLTFNFANYEFRKIYWPEDRKLNKTLFWGNVYSLPKQDLSTQEGAKLIREVKNAAGDIAAVIVAKE